MENKKIFLWLEGALLLFVAMLLLASGTARAQVTVYTDEAAYLAALSNLGYGTFEEGFESAADWGSARSPNTAASVVSNGIKWQSNYPATNGITTGSGAARTGNWGIFDPDHGSATGTTLQCNVGTPPPECFFHDGFTGVRETGTETLYGVGGWIKTNTPFARINFILDNTTTVDFETVQLGTTFLFFGVIDTTGFSAFEIREVEGKVGDQKFIFADDFTFGSGGSPPANTPPVARDDTYATNEGKALSIPLPGVLTNDTDADGDALTAVLNAGPGSGALNLNADGSFDYTPNANFTGTDSFTYVANDGAADSNIATVTITVTPLVIIPVDTYTVTVNALNGVAIADASVSVDLAGTAPQITDAGGHATFTLPAGGTYVFTIQAAGYITQSVSSGNKTVDVTLIEIEAAITGIVEDTQGTPLVGATVVAYQPANIAAAYHAVTGAGGAYTINLPMGAPNSGYTVVASLSAYASVERINQDAGIVDFTGFNGLQTKTTITSIAADVVGTEVSLGITAAPAFTAVSEAVVTLSSTGGTGRLGPLSFAGGTITVTNSAVEDFTVVIAADTSEDNDPGVGYFASSAFNFKVDDPATANARMDMDAGGGTLNLAANNQTTTLVVPVGGASKPATFVIKQVPKTVQASDTEGSPTYVYEVTALDSATGAPLAAADINSIVITLPIDLNTVQPGDLENGVYVIYQAPDPAALEDGVGTSIPASQIISTDYVGDGKVGSVRFQVDHLTTFAVGSSTAAVTPPTGGGGGGGGGGCFISTLR